MKITKILNQDQETLNSNDRIRSSSWLKEERVWAGPRCHHSNQIVECDGAGQRTAASLTRVFPYMEKQGERMRRRRPFRTHDENWFLIKPELCWFCFFFCLGRFVTGEQGSAQHVKNIHVKESDCTRTLTAGNLSTCEQEGPIEETKTKSHDLTWHEESES